MVKLRLRYHHGPILPLWLPIWVHRCIFCNVYCCQISQPSFTTPSTQTLHNGGWFTVTWSGAHDEVQGHRRYMWGKVSVSVGSEWCRYINLSYSITGLLAARVCSDHFSHVILIDPELSEVERTKPSARIAQYDSLHGMYPNVEAMRCCYWEPLDYRCLGYLTFVLDGLRRLWPTFDTELTKAGG